VTAKNAAAGIMASAQASFARTPARPPARVWHRVAAASSPSPPAPRPPHPTAPHRTHRTPPHPPQRHPSMAGGAQGPAIHLGADRGGGGGRPQGSRGRHGLRSRAGNPSPSPPIPYPPPTPSPFTPQPLPLNFPALTPSTPHPPPHPHPTPTPPPPQPVPHPRTGQGARGCRQGLRGDACGSGPRRAVGGEGAARETPTRPPVNLTSCQPALPPTRAPPEPELYSTELATLSPPP